MTKDVNEPRFVPWLGPVSAPKPPKRQMVKKYKLMRLVIEIMMLVIMNIT
jgi:hypothetical protein